ncbi:MAG: hypothetical protein KA319_12725, partial [Ferruginibacter sp.]|nr:hypothetical protein [Ferruginibacter sp.]
ARLEWDSNLPIAEYTDFIGSIEDFLNLAGTVHGIDGTDALGSTLKSTDKTKTALVKTIQTAIQIFETAAVIVDANSVKETVSDAIEGKDNNTINSYDGNSKPKPVEQTVQAPSKDVKRDPNTKKVIGYTISSRDSIPSHNNKTPDTIRTTKYKKPN